MQRLHAEGLKRRGELLLRIVQHRELFCGLLPFLAEFRFQGGVILFHIRFFRPNLVEQNAALFHFLFERGHAARALLGRRELGRKGELFRRMAFA